MTVAHDIVAALSGGFTENARLLVLHTPLGTDRLVAERATVEEAIGPAADPAAPRAGFRIAVDALSTDTHLELKTLIGQPVLLELLTAESRSALRPFHGHVTEAALLGSDGGLARYRLVVEPWLAFLAHRVDAWVFQDKSVVDIVEEVFADHAGQGRLVPAWRWDLEDRSVYARRSLCVQYAESDLDFVLRLLREEGLFAWFEHAGAAADAALGSHTLVLADHNAAFGPAAQPRLRFTQPGPTLAEDSVVRWRDRAALQASAVSLASHDYRSLSMRAQTQSSAPDGDAPPPPAGLVLDDVPGLYAYEDSSQGERLARRQMQALDALRATSAGEATVRTLAPGTTFTLADHPVHDGRDAARDRFVALSVSHRARNNVRADHKAALQSLADSIAGTRAESHAGHRDHHVLGESPSPRSSGALANAGEEPLYACRFTAQRAIVPVRMAALADDAGIDGVPDPRLHPRPTVHGVQTAVVVGVAGQPLTTDRDHRVKVQFHWQRGARSGHRLDHPAGDNAPASEASGTWVRVAERVAGSNWGGHFVPRVGQEVLVQFVAGDIDRPVVVGAVYNGEGSADAQGNRIAGGGSGATGNAAAWFPGGKREGKLESHAHAAVLAGYKSQELSTSQSGTGGHSQLVFDDSAAGSRIELSTTTERTRLQLGHLLQQDDNRRLQPRGHGIDLTTTAWGAVRAGSGLLLSAHGKAGSTAAGSSLESREPLTQLESGRELVHALAENAQQQKAMLEGEPGIVGAKAGEKGPRLPAEIACDAAIASLGASDQRGDAGSGDTVGAIGGGAGKVAAWSRPDLVVAAPKGVAAVTPATMVVSAGNTATWAAGQDLQLAAQANHAWSIAGGLVFFTVGKAISGGKPNTETGIRFHAATGNASAQSLTGAARLTADKKVEVASTAGMVRVTAPQHVLLTAAGAALDIQPSSITLKGPGKIEFKASMKELMGAGSASQSVSLGKAGPLKICEFRATSAANGGDALVSI